MKLKSILLACAVSLSAALSSNAAEYNISVSADWSGPLADSMPNAMSGITAVFDWWNREVGKGLGVTVNPRIYDMRYDAAVVAKTWPSILTSDKPIMHLGFGGPDLITLMKRLPNDQVPMLMGTAMVGLVWVPDGWHYSIRPTYSHEYGGVMQKMYEEKGRKIRFGYMVKQDSATVMDVMGGLRKLAEMHPDRFEFVDVQYADFNPVTVTPQMRAFQNADVDVIICAGTVPQVSAMAKSHKELGMTTAIMTSTHNGWRELSKVVDLKDLDGSLSAFSFAAPGKEKLELRELYEANKGAEGEWSLVTEQSAAQAILALRIVEQAVKAVGADNVTGVAMRQALLASTYSEADLFGVLPDLDFDESSPFPVGELRAMGEVIRDGKIEPLASDWLPVPAIDKW